jgi:hypothetical protein
MTNDAQKYEQIFSGTKEVAEKIKIEISKLHCRKQFTVM